MQVVGAPVEFAGCERGVNEAIHTIIFKPDYVHIVLFSVQYQHAGCVASGMQATAALARAELIGHFRRGMPQNRRPCSEGNVGCFSMFPLQHECFRWKK